MKQNQRKTGTEQYYTPPEIARQCLNWLDTIVTGNIYLEPAGGTGSFVNALQENGRNVISFDIAPKHPSILPTVNFLNEDISHLANAITITNPPFGRNNSLSVPFFNKCAEVSSFIAFLVPRSWRKWSVLNRLDRRFHLVFDVDLNVDFIYPENAAKSKGKLNTVFQIYEKREKLRPLVKIEDRGYITKAEPALADVALTVFGRGCGIVRRDFPRKPNTTQMFLKCAEPWVVDALQSIDFSRFYQNVAFVEALSIMEINFLLNEYRDGVLGVSIGGKCNDTKEQWLWNRLQEKVK